MAGTDWDIDGPSAVGDDWYRHIRHRVTVQCVPSVRKQRARANFRTADTFCHRPDVAASPPRRGRGGRRWRWRGHLLPSHPARAQDKDARLRCRSSATRNRAVAARLYAADCRSPARLAQHPIVSSNAARQRLRERRKPPFVKRGLRESEAPNRSWRAGQETGRRGGHLRSARRDRQAQTAANQACCRGRSRRGSWREPRPGSGNRMRRSSRPQTVIIALACSPIRASTRSRPIAPASTSEPVRPVRQGHVDTSSACPTSNCRSVLFALCAVAPMAAERIAGGRVQKSNP